MRARQLAAIALVAACSSNGSRPRRARPAPPPQRQSLPGASREVPPPPAPVERQPPPVPAGAIRLAGVDSHRAALLLAQVFRVDVIVVGGTGEPVTVGIRSETAEGAFRELASAAGLSVRPRAGGFELGPPGAIARGGSISLRGGRRIDVLFYRADAANVVRILEEVGRVSIEGSLTGTVSMAVRGAPSMELLGAIVRLGGREARSRGRAVILSGAAELPATPAGGGEPCAVDPERERHAELSCVSVLDLEVCGTAAVGDRPVALVRRRGAGPGSGVAAEVRPGSLLGELGVRVASVDTDGVVLEGGVRLPLGGSPIPACTRATLEAFTPGDGRATREAMPPETYEWVDPSLTASHSVSCLADESDPDCETRARRLALASHAGHEILSTAIEAADAGVEATLEVDGRREDIVVPSHEAVAERMRELLAQGRRVMLLRSEVRRDPEDRRAIVQLQQERARVERRSRALLRIDWAPRIDPADMDAIHAAVRRAAEQAERSGVFLRELAPQPGGTIRLVVGCP